MYWNSDFKGLLTIYFRYKSEEKTFLSMYLKKLISHLNPSQSISLYVRVQIKTIP